MLGPMTMICRLEDEAVEATLEIGEEVATTVVEPAICVVYDSTEEAERDELVVDIAEI